MGPVDAAVAAPSGAAADPTVPVPDVAAVKHSNEAIEALRRKIPQTSTFLLHVMGNTTTECHVNGMVIFGRPLAEDTKKRLTQTSTQSGRKECHVDLACGAMLTRSSRGL